MKSEEAYKNCIHDIGLYPFYVHFHVPETLHLYRAYCKNTPYPSLIVDATGSVIKRFSNIHFFIYPITYSFPQQFESGKLISGTCTTELEC